MRRKFWIGMIVVVFCAMGLNLAIRLPQAAAQKGRDEAQWEYKVGVLSYNPGDRLSDEKRAARFARELNEEARQGWEPVGSLLTRDTVYTAGGAVATRDTTSFVAYRRRR